MVHNNDNRGQIISQTAVKIHGSICRQKRVKTSDRYVKGKGEGDQAICYQALQGVVKPFVTRRHIGLGELKCALLATVNLTVNNPFF